MTLRRRFSSHEKARLQRSATQGGLVKRTPFRSALIGGTPPGKREEWLWQNLCYWWPTARMDNLLTVKKLMSDHMTIRMYRYSAPDGLVSTPKRVRWDASRRVPIIYSATIQKTEVQWNGKVFVLIRGDDLLLLPRIGLTVQHKQWRPTSPISSFGKAIVDQTRQVLALPKITDRISNPGFPAVPSMIKQCPAIQKIMSQMTYRSLTGARTHL
eukprot:2580057-Amphidinium_carterae.1